MLPISRVVASVVFAMLFAGGLTASSPSACAQYDCHDILTIEVPEVPQELMCGIATQCTLRFWAQECMGNDPETVEVYSIGPFGFPTTPKVELEEHLCNESQWWAQDTCGDPTWGVGKSVYFIADYGAPSPDELVAASVEWVACSQD